MKIGKFFAKISLYADQTGRGIVYHYTSPEVLRGILENREFWLTNYRFLNDPAEISVGLEIARQEFSNGPYSILAEFCDKGTSSCDVFTGSFSEHRDNLGQWRAYGGNGRGVCIGFNAASIIVRENAIVCGEVQYDVRRDQWDESQATPWQEGFCRGFENKFFWNDAAGNELQQVASNQIDGVSLDDVALLFRQHLLWNCSLLKHGAYAEEKEWRIAILKDPEILAGFQIEMPVRTRLRGYQEVPYLALPLPSKGLLKEVMLGPATTETDKQLIEKMLKEFGYGDVIPTKSAIPYRPA